MTGKGCNKLITAESNMFDVFCFYCVYLGVKLKLDTRDQRQRSHKHWSHAT